MTSNAHKARYVPTRQATIADRVEFSGIGIHNGSAVSLSINPCDSNTGIVFVRTDRGQTGMDIPARFQMVCATELCTALGVGANVSISTVEHLMAALRGMGVDNAVIEIDGSEVPVLDGSSEPFVREIQQVGLRFLDAPRRYIRVLRPIRVEIGDRVGELSPHDGFELDITIDFSSKVIGRQQVVVEVTPDTFVSELCRARTFGFMDDVEKLWASGFGLGASLENSVVLSDDKILNQEGLRFADEFVRHKALDAVGDIALAGYPILGRYRSVRGGHRLNHLVLQALFDAPDAWSYVDMPARREKAAGTIAAGVAVPAFGPDVS